MDKPVAAVPPAPPKGFVPPEPPTVPTEVANESSTAGPQPAPPFKANIDTAGLFTVTVPPKPPVCPCVLSPEPPPVAINKLDPKVEVPPVPPPCGPVNAAPLPPPPPPAIVTLIYLTLAGAV